MFHAVVSVRALRQDWYDADRVYKLQVTGAHLGSTKHGFNAVECSSAVDGG